MHRRVFLAASLSAAAPAALARPMRRPPPGRLVLEEWLRGRTHAVGRFTNALSGAVRPLAVDFVGRWDGRVFTFDERFFYADGERDRKIWRFAKIDDDNYAGTRPDVTTPAPVTRESDQTLRIRYSADIATGSSTTNLTFDDRLTLRPDDTILNVATVSKLFLVVGSVELVFRKGPLPARLMRTGGA
jgi:hypothetical protein